MRFIFENFKKSNQPISNHCKIFAWIKPHVQTAVIEWQNLPILQYLNWKFFKYRIFQISYFSNIVFFKYFELKFLKVAILCKYYKYLQYFQIWSMFSNRFAVFKVQNLPDSKTLKNWIAKFALVGKIENNFFEIAKIDIFWFKNFDIKKLCKFD